MRLRSTSAQALASSPISSFRYILQWAHQGRNADITKDLEFAGGVIHIVDHPMAPPYSLKDTGTVLGINAIAGIFQARGKGSASSFLYQNTSDVTVFVPQNSALVNTSAVSSQAAANSVVLGPVLYSTALTAGRTYLTAGKAKLFVTTNASGSVFVNGSRIIESDILTANGVVHVIER